MQAEYQYTNHLALDETNPFFKKEGYDANIHLGMVENGTQLILDQNSFSKSNEKLSFLNQCEFG